MAQGNSERMATEPEKVVHLKGSPQNPGRDPKKKVRAGDKGSMGDQAFMDAVVIVALAWAFLVVLAFSLRHHNV